MPNQDPKRDLQADRAKLTELKEQARNDLSWGVALDVFSRTALPHYLTRTETAEQRVAEVEAERDEAVAAVKEQDAALAQMRGALEFYVEDERELCLTLGCNDCKTGSLANTCRDAKRTGAARTALSADSGKATLERIKGLEADNEAMRGLLKKIRDAIPTCESCDLPQHDDEDRCDTCINVHLDAIDAFLKGGGKDA